jgi:hypothetical protein
LDADNDRALAKAIQNASSTVVLGYFFHMSDSDLDYKILPGQVEKQIERISNSKYPIVMDNRKGNSIEPFITAFMPESNLAIFTEAAAASGYYSVQADPDGVVRWMLLIIKCREDLFPPLALLCTWFFLDRPPTDRQRSRLWCEGDSNGTTLHPHRRER